VRHNSLKVERRFHCSEAEARTASIPREIIDAKYPAGMAR